METTEDLAAGSGSCKDFERRGTTQHRECLRGKMICWNGYATHRTARGSRTLCLPVQLKHYAVLLWRGNLRRHRQLCLGHDGGAGSTCPAAAAPRAVDGQAAQPPRGARRRPAAQEGSPRAGGGGLFFTFSPGAEQSFTGFPSFAPRCEPPRARAPGAQMIRMGSGSGLAFKRHHQGGDGMGWTRAVGINDVNGTLAYFGM
eukprot:gene9054-biopygen3183